VNKLKIYRIVEKLLRSFPKKFESILESKYLSSFSVEEMMGSHMSHETRLNLEEGYLEHAFKTQKYLQRQRKQKQREK
jgi:hypothetical protein